MSQTICTSVSSRDSTKMCPYQAQFTIFRVLACLLLLGVRCVRCVQCVCVCWCVVRVLLGVWLCVVGVRRCVWSCVVVVCRTHSQHHGFHIHTYVHVGVTLFACFLMKRKTQSRTLTFHDVCFSKPLTFQNGFMFFSSRCCLQHFSITSEKRSEA